MRASFSRNMQSNFIDRIKLPFRKEKELIVSLYSILGFYPRHIEYYKLALMHKSGGKREKGKPINNERLEFLGDAILDAVVGDIVYRHFEGKREGFLTNTRSKIVQRETLNRLAHEIGLEELLVVKSKPQSHNSYMGGNAFEALVGAIYLDRGYKGCMKFMEKQILSRMINIDKVAKKEVNFKSKLIEWSQKNRVKMDFHLVSTDKDEGGSPMFHYKVVIEGIDGCEGKGYSKKESQQIASKLTLEKLRKNPKFIDEVFAAKTNRTKMEEMPVINVPDINQKEDFIIRQDADNVSAKTTNGNSRRKIRMANNDADSGSERKGYSGKDGEDEYDLSDISANPKKLSREDIIAQAEDAAFSEKDN